jgi:hypothetical protein
LISTMSSTPCNFDDAFLVMDELAMVETTESNSIVIVEAKDEEESVEGVGKIQQTIDSMMCNTPSGLDAASPPTAVPVIATIETTEFISILVDEREEAECLEGVEKKLIQDLAHFDNAKVNAALDALFNLNLKQKYDTVTAWGGCAALVHLLKDRLKTVMQKSPSCDQVTELNEQLELETIEKTLFVIVKLTYHSSEMGRFGMVAVGGVAAVVEAMRTFPKCQILQRRGCNALRNLAACNIGVAKAIESGGIEVLLAAIHNHLDSEILCESACQALVNIVSGSKENTGLLIILGGGAAVDKVRAKWPDANDVQTRVRKLASLFGAEWNARADEE